MPTAADNARACAQQTYTWDRLRGISQGILETSWQTFGLLVAIRVFEADESIKQYLPAAGGIGLILSPWFLAYFSRRKSPISNQLARNWLIMAAFIGAAAFAPNALLFIACVFMAQFTYSQGLPLMTHLYARNYAAAERGTRLSSTHLLAALGAICFGYIGGWFLDLSISNYMWLFLFAGFAAVMGAGFSQRIPSQSGLSLQTPRLRETLAVVWKDKLFFWMLVGWMLMGMGNLMMIPIRVEYLANPQFGINLSNSQIGILLVSVVMTFRLLSTRMWGILFDRINLITMRLLLNALFMLSIVVFFNTQNFWILALGCALLGLAFGGGGIMWALFVTKVAPEEKVAAYMSVHGFFTGIRAASAPFLGYALLNTHPSFAAWVALVLIGASTVIFLPMRQILKKRA